MDFYFENITIRSSTDNDIPFVCRLESDVENSRFITSWPAEKHSAAVRNSDTLHAIVLYGDRPVGFIILTGLHNSNKSIEFMRVVIGEKGKGIGRKTLRAVKALCFSQFNAHRLWLDVKTFNERAKHLYKSEGFVIEGTLRDCLKSGEHYESLTILSILENEAQRLL